MNPNCLFCKIIRLLTGLCSSTHKTTVVFTATISQIVFKGTNMGIIARIDQEISLAPSFTDAAGNPVTDLGSTPVWTVSDEAIAALTVSADGLTASVVPTGTLGTIQVNMVVDADPDEDVEEINGVVEITFKAGKAHFVNLTPTITDKPAAPQA